MNFPIQDEDGHMTEEDWRQWRIACGWVIPPPEELSDPPDYWDEADYKDPEIEDQEWLASSPDFMEQP